MSHTIAKLNYVFKIFKRIRSSLTTKSAIMVFKAKFLSYINYILLISTLASKRDMRKIQVLQNAGIRCVFNLPKRNNVDGHHVKLGTLHVEQRQKLFVLIHMYKRSLDMPYPVPQNDDGIQTRSSNKILFNLPTPKSDRFLKSFAYKGVVDWNSLSSEEQLVGDTDQFKNQQKKQMLLVEQALYGPTT